MKLRRVLMSLLAPVSAVIVALAITSVALLAIHKNPFTAFDLMARYAGHANSVISIINKAIPLYLSAMAVAIGFKMNLFNIGVEGQYTLAALVAGGVAPLLHLPPPIEITIILLVAMAVGAVWSGIAGVLKVTRGVHEVISTIMLNLIATSGLVAYLLNNYLKQPLRPTDLTTHTRDVPKQGLFPALVHNPFENLSGFLIVAVIVGILFYVIVWRTKFGYNLRATGVNPEAARVSGIDPRAMVIKTMMLSGAIAGLVGMEALLFELRAYGLDFPTGLGFLGIAVALVGRNHPVGMGIAALLFGFLDRSAQILDLNNIPKEIFLIIEGVIILTVVIAYEVVRRLVEADAARVAAQATIAAPMVEPVATP